MCGALCKRHEKKAVSLWKAETKKGENHFAKWGRIVTGKGRGIWARVLSLFSPTLPLLGVGSLRIKVSKDGKLPYLSQTYSWTLVKGFFHKVFFQQIQFSRGVSLSASERLKLRWGMCVVLNVPIVEKYLNVFLENKEGEWQEPRTIAKDSKWIRVQTQILRRPNRQVWIN